MSKTKVIFRKYIDDEVIALFPELPGTDSVLTCMSYMHCGQHGAASAVIDKRNSVKASKDEYRSLQKELERAGYELQVVSRFSYQMDLKRAAALRAI